MKALYAAASGMAAQQLRLDNVANNLANVNTTGFKGSRQSFQDLFYQEIATGGAGGETNTLQLGSGVRTAAVSRDLSAGTLTATGNPLDIAIEGDGYFGIESPEGEPMYTRDGSFTVNADGTMVTHSGLRVSGDITIPTDAENISVLPDGTVSAQLIGDVDATVLGQLELVNFANPGGLAALGGNLFSASPTSGDAQMVEPDQARVVQGYLEGSNVDVGEELIEMILAQRAFELNSKAVQAADETLQTAVNLRR